MIVTGRYMICKNNFKFKKRTNQGPRSCPRTRPQTNGFTKNSHKYFFFVFLIEMLLSYKKKLSLDFFFDILNKRIYFMF